MRKKDCIAMLLAGGEGRRLSPLTAKQAKPAVPFGGRYRIIDFPLSNCANSGIDTVGVLTQYEAESLHNHIGEGDPWRLPHSEDGGITLLPPTQCGTEAYAGTADAIYKNMAFVDSYSPKHVLILSGDHIYHMNYRRMLDFHLTTKAKATISVMPVPWEEAHRFGVISMDDRHRITEFAEKPDQPASNLASMGIYMFEWEYLKQQLTADAQSLLSSHDFGKDVIPSMLSGIEPLYAYQFNGYWRDVGTVRSLWEAHMDLLEDPSAALLHRDDWPMLTRELSPGLSLVRRRSLQSSTVLVHEQCLLEGHAERSVVFAGTEIARHAWVKDSVVMPGAKIGKHALVENAIIGEGAVLKEGAIIKGNNGEIAVVGPGEIVAAKPALRPQPSRLLQEVYDNAPRLRAEGLLS
ncbi:glucose-1-phosphate adenylyltransferase [Paenibacillus sanguinis]|uniref:glucose-1-phosphate adenylyltransferase n=1 Tax=Paenibacillus sanguinis TaxID=225906 RepID=UPI000367CD79|nr:glucose-1-phosphate adenylyltransferase [Paenibacillus sanguinis]